MNLYRHILALYIILFIGLVPPLHNIEASENSNQSKKINRRKANR